MAQKPLLPIEEALDKFPLLKAILPVNKYKHVLLYDGREKSIFVNVFSKDEAHEWMKAFAKTSGCTWSAESSQSDGLHFLYKVVMKCKHITTKQISEHGCPARYRLMVCSAAPSGSEQSSLEDNNFQNQYPTAIRLSWNHNHSNIKIQAGPHMKNPEANETQICTESDTQEKSNALVTTKIQKSRASDIEGEPNEPVTKSLLKSRDPESQEKPKLLAAKGLHLTKDPNPCIAKNAEEKDKQMHTPEMKKMQDAYMKVIELFKRGHCPATAFDIFKHDMYLQEGTNYLKALEEGGLKDIRDCQRLFKRLKKVEFTQSSSQLKEHLEALVNEYNTSQKETCAAYKVTSQGTQVLAICSPLMRRAHAQLQHCDEICFFDTRNDGKRTTCQAFFLLSPSVVGGLPLGAIITDSPDEDSVYEALELLKTIFPSNAFGGRKILGPKVFLTRLSELDQNAIRHAFPSAASKISVLHIVQHAWQWIVTKMKIKNASHNQRALLLYLLKDFVVAETEAEMEDKLKRLLQEPIVKAHKSFEDLLQNQLYAQRKLWMPQLWQNLELKSYHSKNFFTLGLQVLNDRIMYHCETFTMPSLFHFFMTRLDDYYEHRMMNIINKRPAVITYRYMPLDTFLEWEVKKVVDDYYTIRIGKKRYDLDISTCVCTCDIGCCGGPCMHQGYLHRSFNLLPYDIKDNLDVQKAIEYMAKGGMTLPRYKLPSHSSFIPDGIVRKDKEREVDENCPQKHPACQPNGDLDNGESLPKVMDMSENTESNISNLRGPFHICKDKNDRKIIQVDTSDNNPPLKISSQVSNWRNPSSLLDKTCVLERAKIRRSKDDPYAFKVRVLDAKVNVPNQDTESTDKTCESLLRVEADNNQLMKETPEEKINEILDQTVKNGNWSSDFKTEDFEIEEYETFISQPTVQLTEHNAVHSSDIQNDISCYKQNNVQSLNKKNSECEGKELISSEQNHTLNIKIQSCKSLSKTANGSNQDLDDAEKQTTGKSNKDLILAFVEVCNKIVKMAWMNEKLVSPALSDFVKCMHDIGTDTQLVSALRLFVQATSSKQAEEQQPSPHIMVQPLQMILQPQQLQQPSATYQPVQMSHQFATQPQPILQPTSLLQPQQPQQTLTVQPIQVQQLPVLQPQDPQLSLQPQHFPHQQLKMQQIQYETVAQPCHAEQEIMPHPQFTQQQLQQHIQVTRQEQKLQLSQHKRIPVQNLEIPVQQQQQNVIYQPIQQQQFDQSQSSLQLEMNKQGQQQQTHVENLQCNSLGNSKNMLVHENTNVPVYGSTHILVNGISKGSERSLPPMSITYTCSMDSQTPHECLLLVPTSVAIRKGIHKAYSNTQKGSISVNVPFNSMHENEACKMTSSEYQANKTDLANIPENESNHDRDPLRMERKEQNMASIKDTQRITLKPEIITAFGLEEEMTKNIPKVYTW